MTELFLKVVNMSISASWLILAVLLIRFALKKAPKWVNVLLWAIVAVRLICPFSIESALSLIPSVETISPEIMMDWTPEISTGVSSIDKVVNPIITETFTPEPIASANPLQLLIPVLAIIWAIGVAVLLIYTAVSYWRLRRKVSEAVILRDNIFQSENVSSPFVLGIIKPRIYLSYHMEEQDLAHVVAHEQAHIKRRDHWWKALGFLLLTIHWFNPLMWVAYVLLCRDIELACDEKVIKELGNEQRADYSKALVSCSVNRRTVAACPLAFGEVGVKERVKSVMNYKKPAFWIVVLAVIACVVVAVCFLTNPAEKEQDLSFLNYKNLPELAYQAETLECRYPNDHGVAEGSIEGKLLGEFLDEAVWEELKLRDSYKLEPDIEISFDSELHLGFSKNQPELALITSLGKTRRYTMINTSFDDVLALIKPADASETTVFEGAEAVAVTWTYSPMMSATWHAAFHFNFDLNREFIHIEAACDNGILWNPRADGQPKGKTLRFETGQPVCWVPGVDESLTDTTEDATVSFAVYDGEDMLYQGAFEIARAGTDNGQSFYEAQMIGTDLLTMQQEDGNMGASVILSDRAAIVAWTDLNHNRVNEQVVVREIHPGMVYELSAVENGMEIWKTEASPAHVGWNTIMLYQEDGESYLVEYRPSMFQGAGSYTCMVFSLKGNKQTIKENWSVDFELGKDGNVRETAEMTQFAEKVNLLMRNSSVLLSTEQGVLVNRHGMATALPQLYPVHFDPDDIQRAMEATADPTAPQELTTNAATFPQEPLEFMFASGAGAWGTHLTLFPDGRFVGDYGDSDGGTRYVCKFEGQFTDIQQISDYCWSMKLGDVTIEQEEGTTWTEDGIRYIAYGPHGISGGTNFLLYAPETSADLLPTDCRDWWPEAYLWRSGEIDILDGWGLCNLEEGIGFFTSQLS